MIPLRIKGRSVSSSVTYSTTLLRISNIVTLEKVQYTHTVMLCSRNTIFGKCNILQFGLKNKTKLKQIVLHHVL